MKQTKINQQEIFLIERYVSVDYFGELRDTWESLTRHVEGLVAAFMKKLPLDYRRRSQSGQPDIVWGEHVLPNFRNTLQSLNTGFIKLSHGDLDGLKYAHGPLNDFKGQTEYSSSWMGQENEGKYADLLNKAVVIAANICHTESAEWAPNELTNWYSESNFGPLDLPLTLPSYRLNSKEKISSGGKLRRAGIYVPDLPDSCAQFLSLTYVNAPEACVFITGEGRRGSPSDDYCSEAVEYEYAPCTWELVERMPNLKEGLLVSETEISKSYRVEGGEICPDSGYYFTPSVSNSRRFFERGESIPKFSSAYGITIWQWDKNQEDE